MLMMCTFKHSVHIGVHFITVISLTNETCYALSCIHYTIPLEFVAEVVHTVNSSAFGGIFSVSCVQCAHCDGGSVLL